jgi:leader peptidase (prepilin peptidase)/N-methyltransferase
MITTILNVLIALCFGAFIGKFIAMTVHYLPQILLEGCDKGREPNDIFKWFFKKPFCWHCQHPLPWLKGLPIYGYFSAKKKCTHCKHRIEKKTLALEIGTALLFATSILLFPLNLTLLFVLVMSCLLICCFMTDFKHCILPDQFTATLLWVGLIGSLFTIFVPPREALVGAVGGYGFFWIFNLLYRALRGVDGVFPGDFKLNAAIGACFGLSWLLPIILGSLMLLIVFNVLKALWSWFGPSPKGQSLKSLLQQEVPYGCYVSFVAFVVLYLKAFGLIENIAL